jgi:ribosomal protein L22
LWLDREDLYVARVDVWRGPKLKRVRFVARARVHGYVKHRSFVRVVLNSK